MDRKLKLLGPLEPNFAGMMFVRSSIKKIPIPPLPSRSGENMVTMGNSFFCLAEALKKSSPLKLQAQLI
jgi:hypothetical protein